MKLEFSCFQLLLLIVYFKYVKLVPDEYCLTPLNTSDCGTPPTPVFSYYKYGSRCEIKTWRGCPTENMFENEYHCSHYCIGKTNYYGRERGSWKGRAKSSIEDLSIKELEDINKILHGIDDMFEEEREKLVYTSPAREPATKTTVKAKTGKTTVDARTEEDGSEEECAEHDITEKRARKLVTITQDPVTGYYINHPTALKLRQNSIQT